MEQTTAAYIGTNKVHENRKQMLSGMIGHFAEMLGMCAGKMNKKRGFAEFTEEQNYMMDEPVIRQFGFHSNAL